MSKTNMQISMPKIETRLPTSQTLSNQHDKLSKIERIQQRLQELPSIELSK
jgi:hypothetical protein